MDTTSDEYVAQLASELERTRTEMIQFVTTNGLTLTQQLAIGINALEALYVLLNPPVPDGFVSSTQK